jgi:hypothetical protein
MAALSNFAKDGNIEERWRAMFGERTPTVRRLEKHRRRALLLFQHMRVACENEWLTRQELVDAFGPGPFLWFLRVLPPIERAHATRMGRQYNWPNERFFEALRRDFFPSERT